MKTRTRFRELASTRGVVHLGLLTFALSLVVGCNMPGKPEESPEVPRPEQIKSFDALYGDNCAGCHGANGQKGAAMNLANPEYQALVDDVTLRDIITNGEKGTLMPALSLKRGGELTDEQIDILVKGMRARWSKGNVLAGLNAPSWKATLPADAAKGKEVYIAACARCHGADLQKPGTAGAILDGSFLAVVNEQMVRTTVIAGRPDLGMPDWRTLKENGPMTDQEVTDVTAWLMAQKPALPGQPYSNSGVTSAETTKQSSGKE